MGGLGVLWRSALRCNGVFWSTMDGEADDLFRSSFVVIVVSISIIFGMMTPGRSDAFVSSTIVRVSIVSAAVENFRDCYHY